MSRGGLTSLVNESASINVQKDGRKSPQQRVPDRGFGPDHDDYSGNSSLVPTALHFLDRIRQSPTHLGCACQTALY
jgi:hypothetical protein